LFVIPSQYCVLQVLHEAIREHSMQAGYRVKGEGAPNDLLERIAQDALFSAVHGSLQDLLDPALFVGRAPQQVDDFLRECVDGILADHAAALQSVTVDAVNV
jgi:adenylosuccinate lyase